MVILRRHRRDSKIVWHAVLSSIRTCLSIVNRIFDRANHDLSVINAIYTVSAGAVVVIGVQVYGWFSAGEFPRSVVGIFAAMIVLLVLYVGAANTKPAAARFGWYLAAGLISLLFPWFAMYLTAHDLAPQ